MAVFASVEYINCSNLLVLNEGSDIQQFYPYGGDKSVRFVGKNHRSVV